ncbi:MAG: hypothetical protein DHS20C18_50550 [Saprospiraceae bacterium]|nr:MAG: hypothetical protein DHS20C18_50550 [Saprospiraceae bacterium]
MLVSCAPYDQDKLVGSWQAISVLEEGEPLGVETEVIRIIFSPDASYSYYSTLNYEESGSYYLDSKYLFTTDTINQASTEKAVEILLLTEDSLHLKMMDTGKERILKMVRK